MCMRFLYSLMLLTVPTVVVCADADHFELQRATQIQAGMEARLAALDFDPGAGLCGAGRGQQRADRRGYRPGASAHRGRLYVETQERDATGCPAASVLAFSE